MKYKIALIGGNGFIGSHMQRLFKDKFDLVVYDIANGDDVRDKFKLDRLFQKEQFDVCINLGARAGVPSGEAFYEEYFSTNCIGLKTLIDVCEKYAVRLIHFSSSSAIDHKSIYGITKRAGEMILENSNIHWVIIRPFTVIGENGRKEMVICKWQQQAKKGNKISFYGNGCTFRGYTYVEDLIEGVEKCIEKVEANSRIFNLGGNQKVLLEELWDIFKEVYPDAERDILPLPDYDVSGNMADSTEANEILGWFPKTDIKSKIKQILYEQK